MILRESLNLDRMSGEFQLAWYIIRIAFLIQFFRDLPVGSVFCATLLVGSKAYGLVFFHAISSFCNAGFDLFGNSLVSFQSDPFVLGVISLLIIAGGLGFLVWFDLLATSKRRSLHSRIALLAMIVLLILGTVGFM